MRRGRRRRSSDPDCLCRTAGAFRGGQHLNLLDISHIVDWRLVRGLTTIPTAFEITAEDIGAQSSIGGGGRYNGL